MLLFLYCILYAWHTLEESWVRCICPCQWAKIGDFTRYITVSHWQIITSIWLMLLQCSLLYKTAPAPKPKQSYTSDGLIWQVELVFLTLRILILELASLSHKFIIFSMIIDYPLHLGFAYTDWLGNGMAIKKTFSGCLTTFTCCSKLSSFCLWLAKKSLEYK